MCVIFTIQDLGSITLSRQTPLTFTLEGGRLGPSPGGEARDARGVLHLAAETLAANRNHGANRPCVRAQLNRVVIVGGDRRTRRSCKENNLPIMQCSLFYHVLIKTAILYGVLINSKMYSQISISRSY